MKDLEDILHGLISLPNETEWVEFKENNQDPEEIGQQISAIANSAALHGKDCGYLVWGVKDKSHEKVGTDFKPRQKKVGNEELENWICTQLRPQVNFLIHELDSDGLSFVIFQVMPAAHRPISFKSTEWIRVGSYKKKLAEHSEKERVLWRLFTKESFESGAARSGLTWEAAHSLVDSGAYFRLSRQTAPETESGVLEKLASDGLVRTEITGGVTITNLGALLFAKDLSSFPSLKRKAPRIVFYAGSDRVKTDREIEGRKGYAAGFSGLVKYLEDRLPRSEELRKALRQEIPLFPGTAIRELVANALIHQDLDATGTGPMVEIFSDRIEITNPGTPLIDVQRFLDLPPRSRNERLADLMRRLFICEERGSGVDKVLRVAEIFQLPPPDFQVAGEHTRAILYGPRKFSEMTRDERIRACYQHAGLLRLVNKQMSNETLRQRFSLSSKEYTVASRIIADALNAQVIRPYDPSSKSRRHARYVPIWA